MIFFFILWLLSVAAMFLLGAPPERIVLGSLVSAFVCGCLYGLGHFLGEAIDREIGETYDQHKDSDDDNP